MKDITIKITGRQFIGDEAAEDDIEFVTDGKMYEKNGATYLVYNESELSGFPGCMTTVRIKGDAIRMKRIGERGGYSTEMEFYPGKRMRSNYDTPYGIINMEVLTKSVRNGITYEGKGEADIDFQISLEGLAEGTNRLHIEVDEPELKA